MTCKNCRKQINPEDAYVCDFCSSVYCFDCARDLRICDCYGDFHMYH